MKLYGTEYTRSELMQRIGNLEQIGGIKRFQCSEGKEKGVEQIQIRTGSGLSYYVTPDRGMDIGLAECCGIPISWQSQNGNAHPAYFNDRSDEWLRTAAGGLLMTCGLTNAGAPSVDQGRALGLHGRAHHTPAKHISVDGQWSDNEYDMRAKGVIEETAIFGEHVVLQREILSRLGENRIRIKDTVENCGFQTVPHMILYHFNFGFPLLSEHTEIMIPSKNITPREPTLSTDGFDRWEQPDPAYKENVYYHGFAEEERAEVMVRNPRFPFVQGAKPLTVRLSWDSKHLPLMVQWKMCGAGNHVLGLEPSNCRVGGRAEERESGRLKLIKPGEVLVYDLELEINGA